ncbi:MAG: ribonuclease III [Oscillospiraceae bacterium]|jgi:ribonuclease-3 family protein|nr:ribonuclease III [Oscillospiraceae bacterium]
MLFTPLTENQISALGILAVASVGDSVYDLMVRVKLCAEGVARAEEVHNKRVEYVNARTQAKAARTLVPLLSPEEAGIFRRGRNAQTGSVPPSASKAEYQAATALEALFGWLCLSGRDDRLRELFAYTQGASAQKADRGAANEDE